MSGHTNFNALRDSLRLNQQADELITELQADRLNLRRVVKAVAGIRSGCCGQTDDPLAWCIHDDARVALKFAEWPQPTSPDTSVDREETE